MKFMRFRIALSFVVAISLVSLIYLLSQGERDPEARPETNLLDDVNVSSQPEPTADNPLAGASDNEDLSWSSHLLSGPLLKNSYIQATLEDEETVQTRTLRISGVEARANFFQYEFESTEGELGLITVSPKRVFAFMQARDGVYEYAGDSLELNLRRSRMEGLENDVYRSELKAIRK